MPTAVLDAPRPAVKAGGWVLLRRLLTGLALLGWLGTAALGGRGMAFAVLLFAACCTVYLILPGWALADWLAPKQRGLTGLYAAVYGCGFLAALHCVSVRLGVVWLLRLLPPVLVLLWLIRRHHSGTLDVPRAVRRLVDLLDSNTGLFWALLCLLYAVRFGAINPFPTAAGAVHLDQDMLWNVGNAAALSQHFPAEDIRFSGVRLSYHYLTELLSAALGLVSGVELYDIYVFLAGPLFLAGELVALKVLARAYFGAEHPHADRALILLLYGFSCLSLWKAAPYGLSIFGNTLLQHLVTNINAQATALIFLCGFMVSFIRLSRAHFAPDVREVLALFLSFGLLCVAKGPEAAIVVCAFAVTMVLVLLFQRPHYGVAAFCLVGLAAVFAVTYFILFASGSNSMELTIFAMKDYVCYQVLSPYADWLCAHLPISGYVWLFLIGVADVFCMMPLQFLLWASDVPDALRRLFTLDPARILANSVVVGGFLGYHIFYHTSSSQVYFSLVAMIFMTLLSVEPLERLRGAGVVRKGIGRRRRYGGAGLHRRDGGLLHGARRASAGRNCRADPDRDDAGLLDGRGRRGDGLAARPRRRHGAVRHEPHEPHTEGAGRHQQRLQRPKRLPCLSGRLDVCHDEHGRRPRGYHRQNLRERYAVRRLRLRHGAEPCRAGEHPLSGTGKALAGQSAAGHARRV